MTALQPRPAWCGNVVSAARIRAGELVVVAADEALAEHGRVLLAAVADLGADARFELLAPLPPEELSPTALALARQTDVRIMMWQAPRPPTRAGRELMETLRGRGGRMIGLPLVTPELLEAELSRPPMDLTLEAERLLACLEGTNELRVRGTGGTDLRLLLDGRRWQTDGFPLEAGGFANFPSGEVFALPRTADGTVVADLTIPYVSETLLEQPVTLVFEDGGLTSIEGGAEASRLRELLASAGKGADRVAEVGIGMNPTLSPRGHVLIDEKAAGTAHVAVGSNFHMQGDQMASIHVDCVFRSAEVHADGRAVRCLNRQLARVVFNSLKSSPP